MWRLHQLLSGFLTIGHLLRVSCQSRLSTNEMITGAVHRSTGTCFMPEKTPGEPQLGDRFI